MIINQARKSPTVYLGTSSTTMPDSTAAIVLRNEAVDLAPAALSAVLQRIVRLTSWDANWDGYGSAKPHFGAINSGRSIVPELFRGAALTEYGWSDPHVSANESGDVVLEWWHDNKKVTIYVTPTEPKYVLVWGDNMDTEMDEGIIMNPRQEFKRVWSWLHT